MPLTIIFGTNGLLIINNLWKKSYYKICFYYTAIKFRDKYKNAYVHFLIRFSKIRFRGFSQICKVKKFMQDSQTFSWFCCRGISCVDPVEYLNIIFSKIYWPSFNDQMCFSPNILTQKKILINNYGFVPGIFLFEPKKIVSLVLVRRFSTLMSVFGILGYPDK